MTPPPNEYVEVDGVTYVVRSCTVRPREGRERESWWWRRIEFDLTGPEGGSHHLTIGVSADLTVSPLTPEILCELDGRRVGEVKVMHGERAWTRYASPRMARNSGPATSGGKAASPSSGKRSE